MVENNDQRLPQRRHETDLTRLSDVGDPRVLSHLISQLSPAQQEEVKKQLAKEGVRLVVKRVEGGIDVDIFDEKAKTVINVARRLSDDPTIEYRVEAVHATKEGSSRVVVGRGCLNVLVLLVICILLVIVVF